MSLQRARKRMVDIKKKGGSALVDKEWFDDVSYDENLKEAVKKSIKKPRNRTLARLFLATFIITAVAIFVTGVIRYTELQREKEAYEQKVEEYEAEIEELEYLLGSPMDREYIIRIAKEKLNLYLPDEIIYHNDSSN